MRRTLSFAAGFTLIAAVPITVGVVLNDLGYSLNWLLFVVLPGLYILKRS